MGGVPSELLAAHQPRKAQRIVPGRSEQQYEHCYCGLQPEAGRELFRDKGISGTESQWEH